MGESRDRVEVFFQNRKDLDLHAAHGLQMKVAGSWRAISAAMLASGSESATERSK